jgi:hypothetical protein
MLQLALQFRLIILGFQIFNGLAGFIQTNVVARNILRLMPWLDEIEQMALAARMGAVRVAEIDAGQGILE